MKCIFCQGETVSMWELSPIGDDLVECKTCDPKVRIRVDGHRVLNYAILLTYNGSEYQMSFFLDRDDPKCSFYEIVYGPYGISHDVIFYLDYIPDITPANILFKIPTLLTFS